MSGFPSHTAVRGLLRLMSNQHLTKLLDVELLIFLITDELGIRHIYDMKVLHAQSRELLRLTCKEIKSFGDLDDHHLKGISDIIFRATREGIVEIVRELLKANPSLVRIKDEKSRTIFSFAVLCRQARIWNSLNGLPRKDQILFGPADGSGNTILHMAATVDTSTQLLHKTSAVFQMQRELQWFKEIERIIPPTMSDDLNFENMRAKEIFTRDHKEMLKEGEQWMKDTATSCTVVGTLIVTIMFALAFTVPGGNNSETGLPVFSKNKLFSLFIISDALSLFSSTTSVLMFLGILRSRYAEEDFLKSLPQKNDNRPFHSFLLYCNHDDGLLCSSLHLLPGQSWMVIPIICLASLPVDLYVFMQFSLLVDMIKSTYGPSIFARK
ncbi:hypothetical protein CJ030_MR8G016821 [Morella rubra]|uniref:PGG domain-containing protein n=1 Tax=Morella rubra TaxID=262757 RepID=A0A6A1UTS5_9ROSI|nr:hypothetical protein CJ030_MR8G016821 [Morella rubra]